PRTQCHPRLARLYQLQHPHLVDAIAEHRTRHVQSPLRASRAAQVSPACRGSITPVSNCPAGRAGSSG
ncbi:hypothetical protein PV779_55085, partial [Streptomyces sp. ID01-9D]|nr:hypothetical protein [Streptomyces sp. ID01-9D]